MWKKLQLSQLFHRKNFLLFVKIPQMSIKISLYFSQSVDQSFQKFSLKFTKSFFLNFCDWFFNFFCSIFFQVFLKIFLKYRLWFLLGLDFIILKFLFSNVLEINFEMLQIFYLSPKLKFSQFSTIFFSEFCNFSWIFLELFSYFIESLFNFDIWN